MSHRLTAKNHRPPTPPQRRHDYDSVFNWIVAYKRAHDGNSPTMREIASACHISSLAVVAYILTNLEGQGRITFTPPSHPDAKRVEGRHKTTGHRSRAICIVGGHWNYQP